MSGCKPRNWLGVKMGSVTIVRDLGLTSGDDDHCKLFEGICDCGRRRTVKSKDLSRGRVKTCGSRLCPHRKPGAFGVGFPVVKEAPWQLTAEEALALRKQPCTYCGQRPGDRHLIGLMLIDTKQPYRIGNVVPTCAICGQLRGPRLSHDEFLGLLYRIVSYQIPST